MKKVIALLVVLILMLSSAYAESSIASLSDDELVALYSQIKAEMVERGLLEHQEQTLREGKYVIGKDIPAGIYTITCTETIGEELGDAYGSLGDAADALDDSTDYSSLFNALGSMMDIYGMKIEILGYFGDVLKEYTLKKDDSFSITLEEGTALKISDGSCLLTAAD